MLSNYQNVACCQFYALFGTSRPQTVLLTKHSRRRELLCTLHRAEWLRPRELKCQGWLQGKPGPHSQGSAAFLGLQRCTPTRSAVVLSTDTRACLCALLAALPASSYLQVTQVPGPPWKSLFNIQAGEYREGMEGNIEKLGFQLSTL